MLLFILSLSIFLFSACDDGRIYEHTVQNAGDGRVLKLTGRLAGCEKWTEDYSVVVAGFNGKSEYAVMTKSVSSAAADAVQQVVMAGIGEEVSTVELCVINKLRKRVLTFLSMDCAFFADDTLYMDAGTLDVSMYATIQDQLFNTTCANCHGASTQAAAGLYLTAGHSYAALLNQPSTVMPGELLLKPHDAENSLLYRLLSTDITASWSYDHSKEVLSETMQQLVADWIEGGAEK
ncbi:MAG: hypothetical protein IJ511_01750 [Bacteroides sp.]|nr:hypothetical protein [Bacteroides sp.]